MARLLARSADRLFWGARYVERAEDTARIVRAYNDLVFDYSGAEALRWEPLAVLMGSDTTLDVPDSDFGGERTVLAYLLNDPDNPSSIVSSVAAARSNLRSSREVFPREAWQAMNRLSQHVQGNAAGAVGRGARDRFLGRVIELTRQLDGVIESTMARNEPLFFFRIGRMIERADMTTRVLGVAAASALDADGAEGDTDSSESQIDQVRWMSVLRSVSALQMYQRAVRGPIESMAVVDFLLESPEFPRSVRYCLGSIGRALSELSDHADPMEALESAEAALGGYRRNVDDPDRLDQAMERVQTAIADLSAAVRECYIGDD